MCAVSIKDGQLTAVVLRNLNRANSSASSAIERLSSGLRIVNPSDDPAGTILASTLNQDVRLFNQTLKNISAGVDYLSFASAAYSELTRLNEKMSELAEQASDPVASSEQREALDSELQALITEHRRIVNTTSFNQKRLIDLSNGGESLQVGAFAEGAGNVSVKIIDQFFETIGTGTFGSATNYAVGTGPTSIVSADFNGDGLDDVATANDGSNNVSVLLAQSNGTLDTATNTAISADPLDIASGDFDGDGDIDLVTAGGSGTAATILVNDGSGSFSISATLDAGAGQLSVATADINHDGLIDIITSGQEGGATASEVFDSGSAEVSSVTTAGTGTFDVTELTVVGAPVREVTTLVAGTAVPTSGVVEVTDLTIGFDAVRTGDEVSRIEFMGDAGGTFAFSGDGSYWTFNTPTTDYYVWYNVDGNNNDPGLSGTGIEVAVTSGDDATVIANNTFTALSGYSPDFSVSMDSGTSVVIRNTDAGDVADISIGTISATAVSTLQQGDATFEYNIEAGDGFWLRSPTTSYYVWFAIDGIGTDPSLDGTGIRVDLDSTDSAQDFVNKVNAEVTANASEVFVLTADLFPPFMQFANYTEGVSDDSTIFGNSPSLGISISQQGTDNLPAAIEAGDYFTISTPTTTYHGLYRVDGVFGAPIGGGINFDIDILSTDDADTVAQKTKEAIDALVGTPFSVSRAGDTLTITNVAGGAATDASLGTLDPASASITTTTQGTTTGLTQNSYFTVDTPSTDYYVWFNIGGAGVDPMVGGRTGVQVDLNWGDSATDVASAVAAVLDPLGLVDSTSTNAVVTITNTTVGDASVGTGTTSNFISNTITNGTSSSITSGQYFLFSSPSTDYYVWYNLDGAGGDPALAGRTGVQVNVTSGQTQNQVATATASAIDALADFTSSSVGNDVTITNVNFGATTNISIGTLGAGFSVSTDNEGEDPAVNIATDTITINGHGLSTGEEVTLTTTGSLPGGLATSTNYYVIVLDGNNIQLATSAINATNGTEIDLTTVGVGIQTINGTSPAAGARVFLSNGSGFDAAISTNLGLNPIDIALGDINGDGNDDLVGVDSVQNVVRVAFGAGNGTFSTAVSYTTGAAPDSVNVRDLNNDGLDDVVVTDGTGASVFLSNADGTLSASVSLAGTFTNATGTSIGDLDGDGIPDIAVSDSVGRTNVFINNGSGSFSLASSGTVGTTPSSVALGDVNGDDVLDIITANEGSNNVSVGLANTEASVDIKAFNILTRRTAIDAINIISEIAERISLQKTGVDVAESRLSGIYSSNEVAIENYKAAGGRVMDADIARERANLTRYSIIESAAEAIYAQAVLQPTKVLELLEDGESDIAAKKVRFKISV